MPRIDVDTHGHQWTLGCEFELGCWDTQLPLPEGCSRSPDYTIVNSNSIAAQPNPKVYRYGGEVNTPPTESVGGQVLILQEMLALHKCSINHRSNLHIHIRVPGLKTSLRWLKHLQEYIHTELPKVISIVEPIPGGVTPAEKKRERRRYVSHRTFLTQKRLAHQLAAPTVKEFFEREVPQSRVGKVMWHAQPRVCVNLRQILQTNTIEFRHFPMTLDGEELYTCVLWCKDFLQAAFNDVEATTLKPEYRQFPEFPTFDEELEIGYQATASHNGLNQQEIKQNIRLILDGKFIGSPQYLAAKDKANGI